MALFHLATVSPTKSELIADWAPTQSWGPPVDAPIHVIGSYRFDDPDGRVGMETYLVTAGDLLLHVRSRIATNRSTCRRRLHHGDAALRARHRWVYDGLGDPRFVIMLAAVTMTGQGEALGLAVYDGRWYIAPSNVRIEGGGWTQERVPVDRFELDTDDATRSVLRNDRFELTVSGVQPPEPGHPLP